MCRYKGHNSTATDKAGIIQQVDNEARDSASFEDWTLTIVVKILDWVQLQNEMNFADTTGKRIYLGPCLVYAKCHPPTPEDVCIELLDTDIDSSPLNKRQTPANYPTKEPISAVDQSQHEL